MPDRNAVLCSDCSLLFNTDERVETENSFTTNILVPQSHRLHRFLSSEDPALAVCMAKDCHFCSLLVRFRFRSNQTRNDPPTIISRSQKHDTFLYVIEFNDSCEHSSHYIHIQLGRGYYGESIFKNSGLELFKPSGML